LSEKAKGKQRAADPPDDDFVTAGRAYITEPEPEPDSPRDLLIRFTEGVPDLNITLTKLDSAGDVECRIREARPELLNRRLRLIHAGRLLTHDTLLHPWLTSLEARQMQAEKDAGPANASSPATSATTWFHCSVGQVVGPDDPEEEYRLQTTQIQPIRGFDRLASVGFSQEDIETLRQHFHSMSSSNYLDHNFVGEEDYDVHIRTLEDQWIDSMANAESGPAFLSSSFPNSSILQGLLMGFFFPILPFFLVHGEKPAVFWEDGSELETSNVLFSPPTKTGLLVGFLANVLFGMWRYLLNSS